MEITQSLNSMEWSNYPQVIPKEEYEDVFSFPSQMPPLDFSGVFGFTGLEYFHHEVGIQETGVGAVPLSEMTINDPFYSPLDLARNNALVPEVFFCNIPESVSGVWDELGPGFQAHEPEQQLFLDYNNASEGTMIDDKIITVEEKKKGVKRSWDEEENITNSKKLTRNMISQYFYMPITQAARELNVGLTLLKKRCRELGIQRWPHRKLMSLQTLIKNVQEFGKEGEDKLKESLHILEQEKKLMEAIPDMQLEGKTKRLRQAFFKANYKKRKLMGLVDSSSKTTESTTNHNPPMPDENPANFSDETDHEDEDFKFFFSDYCFSSTPNF